MPVTPTYPGVYIEEIPSGVRTIVGVATSITAFIGRARRGPVNDPTRVQSYAEYGRKFGALWKESTMGYAVQHYFLNGGTDALIVRVENGATASTITVPAGAESLDLEADNPGTWGDNLRVNIDHRTKDPANTDLFNIIVEEIDPDSGDVVQAENFFNVSIDPDDGRYVETVLNQESKLVNVVGVPSTQPDSTYNAATKTYTPVSAAAGSGSDGSAITDAEVATGPNLQTNKEGLWALEKADLFNLLCLPPLERDQDIGTASLDQALAYCTSRRAVLIIDPPSGWNTIDDVEDDSKWPLSTRDKNAAVYFPRIKAPDPLQENRLVEFVPCGVIAGLYARIDAQRGVWKAPAGTEATLAGVRELSYKMTNGENGRLNPLGVNCLRTFPVIGTVSWGARTTAGADQLASEWKYLPVRRLALYIEESLYRGTQWVVFEPNDEPLWAQIRLNVGAFMQNLFRQGAFQGKSPKEAYLVKCDSETTTQADIDRGIVNIIVGFRPLKPAEFVILKITQLAGQSQE